MNLDGYALPIKKLKGTEPVKSLDLSGKKLGVASTIVIASLISVNSSLTELSIYGNCVGDEGVRAICEAIQSNKETKLASLNFGYNGIGPVGANALAAMVAATGSLTSLDLSLNQLCGLVYCEGYGNYTAEGITAIADALRVNGALTSINLSTHVLCGTNRYGGGTYTAEGIIAIADALRVNGSLTKIE